MGLMKKLSGKGVKPAVKKELPIREAVASCDLQDAGKVQLLLAALDSMTVADAEKTIAAKLFNRSDVASLCLPSQYVLRLQADNELDDENVVELLTAFFEDNNEETDIQKFVAALEEGGDEEQEEEEEAEEAEEESEEEEEEEGEEEQEEETVDVSEVEAGMLVDYRPKFSKPPIRCKVLMVDDDGLAILQNVLKPKEKFIDVPGSQYILVKDDEVAPKAKKATKAESKTTAKAPVKADAKVSAKAKTKVSKYETQEVVVELDKHDVDTFNKLMAKSKLVANKPNAVLHSVAKDLGNNRRLYMLVENNTDAGRPVFDMYVQDMRKETPEDDKVLGGLDEVVVDDWNREHVFDVPGMKKTLVVSFN